MLLLTVDEYLDKLMDSVSWLTLLKAAIEVFHGEMRGFANLSDQKELRARQLQPTMRKVLLNLLASTVKEDNVKFLTTLISAAIEFCLNLNET